MSEPSHIEYGIREAGGHVRVLNTRVLWQAGEQLSEAETAAAKSNVPPGPAEVWRPHSPVLVFRHVNDWQEAKP